MSESLKSLKQATSVNSSPPTAPAKPMVDSRWVEANPDLWPESILTARVLTELLLDALELPRSPFHSSPTRAVVWTMWAEAHYS